MKNLSENNVIRFKNITQKKEGIFANFSVKGIINGVTFSASLCVDISALDLLSTDPLEKIIEQSARHAIREFKKSDFRFEGMKTLEESIELANI